MPEKVHHVYKTSVKWREERRGVLEIEGKPPLEFATPAEFGGPEGFWSPEDLFVSAAEGCYLTTFLSIILRRGIELESYESSAEGVLETTDEGVVFTKITIRPKVKVKNPDDAEKVRKFLERAHEYCLVANSMRTEVRVEVE